jgi:GNAT superfamily N-acetyltransferase
LESISIIGIQKVGRRTFLCAERALFVVRQEPIKRAADEIVIRRADPKDLDAVLAVFDSTVAWMVSQGNTKQWGSAPWSEQPRLVERFRHHLQYDITFVASKRGEIVGAIVIASSPPKYCWSGADGDSALYVEPFGTSPEVRGQGVGRALLERAVQYTRDQGKSFLRLDCFAENPKLPAYYESEGFKARGDFAVGEWHGRMFERPVGTIS